MLRSCFCLSLPPHLIPPCAKLGDCLPRFCYFPCFCKPSGIHTNLHHVCEPRRFLSFFPFHVLFYNYLLFVFCLRSRFLLFFCCLCPLHVCPFCYYLRLFLQVSSFLTLFPSLIVLLPPPFCPKRHRESLVFCGLEVLW